MTEQHENNPGGNLLIYRANEGALPIRVLLEGQTIWLTQRLIAELYGTSVPNINQHISAIYEDEELRPEATVKKYLIVQNEGNRQVKRLVDHYNLEMILAVGYRVRSTRGTQFRQWATARLGEYLVKGFTLDDERLKGTASPADYLDDQEIDTLNRITVMFLDQAEFRAQRRQDIRMGDWEVFLDKFLRDTELPVLEGTGRISHQRAVDHANRQYDAFAERRRLAAEAEAEARYVEDLKASAKLLGAERKQPAKKAGRKGKKGKGEA